MTRKRCQGIPDLAQLEAKVLGDAYEVNFHTIQAVEAAFRHFDHARSGPGTAVPLVAAARYLAAHAPTVRAQGQTYEIARRLHRGERLHEPG